MARYAWLPLAWLLTQGFVLLCWVPFRAASFEHTSTFFSAMSGLRDDASLKAQSLPWLLLFVPLLVEHVLVQNPRLPKFPWPRRPLVVLALAGLCFALVLPLLEMSVQNFIYFQF